MQIYYIDILFSHYPRVIDLYQVRISFCRICWLLFFLRGLLLPQLEFALVRAATYSMSNMFQWGLKSLTRFNLEGFSFRSSFYSHHQPICWAVSATSLVSCIEINMDTPSTTEPASWASHPRSCRRLPATFALKESHRS